MIFILVLFAMWLAWNIYFTLQHNRSKHGNYPDACFEHGCKSKSLCGECIKSRAIQ